MTIEVRLDMSRLNSMESRLDARADQAIGKIAADVAADIIRNFSTTSPSAPGQPPGVRTGALKNSIRFARLAKARWAVLAGDQTATYALYLEFGAPRRRLAPRPYVRPAMVRVAGMLPAALRAVVDVG